MRDLLAEFTYKNGPRPLEEGKAQQDWDAGYEAFKDDAMNPTYSDVEPPPETFNADGSLASPSDGSSAQRESGLDVGGKLTTPAVSAADDARVALLERVVRCAPKEWDAVRNEGIVSVTTPQSGSRLVCLASKGDDRINAEFTILMLDELEKMQYRYSLHTGQGGQIVYFVNIWQENPNEKQQFCATSRAWAVAEAFCVACEAKEKA